MDPVRVVVGLGNPGSRYAATRHNIGFRLLDRLALAFAAGRESSGAGYAAARARRGGIDIRLLRPLTYMNRSGGALVRFPESAAAGPENHLVLMDDVALPFGTLRFRRRGSAGGHRGMASVIGALGTDEVPRLRLGVGGAEPGEDLAAYVLGPFSPEEEAEIPAWLDRAVEGVAVFLDHGVEAAMNEFNG